LPPGAELAPPATDAAPPAGIEVPPEPAAPGEMDALASPMEAVAAFDPGQALAGLGSEFAAESMLGDSIIGTSGAVLTHMGTAESRESAVGLFSFHTFKIADNESPWPRNRAYLDTNYFNNVPGTDNVQRVRIGIERTFGEGWNSIGLRLPFWIVDVEDTPTVFPSEVPFGAEGNTSDVGDLTLTLKRVLRRPSYESVLTSGLSVTVPTGPDTLGDVEPYYELDDVSHSGTIQPWLGWYRASESLESGWFLQSFLALDLPFDRDDCDFLFVDLGTGYRMPVHEPRLITAVTPMFEVHWTAPLSNKHQDFTPTSLGRRRLTTGINSLSSGTLAYRHQVNLTTGVTFELDHHSTLALAVVVPTVGPRVMDFELLAQLNMLSW
jgi:hypothetical protein